MANELLINNAFVSAKPDSTDQTLVSSDEWNASLKVTGGVSGNMILRDTSSVTGARMVEGPRTTDVPSTYSGASPSADLGTTVITTGSNIKILLFVNVTVLTSTSGAATMTIYRNSVPTVVITVPGNGVASFYAQLYGEIPGTYTYTVILSIGGGATFTSASVRVESLSLGTL